MWYGQYICRNTKSWWGTDETTATKDNFCCLVRRKHSSRLEQRSYHPVYKKGDKLDPSNYRAITLLSIPGKVFCRMILNRIQVTIDSHLTEEQCGFRSSRGTTDAVFVVRQIIEKARERRIKLHWNFADFKASFDTINFGEKHSGNAFAPLE